MIKNIFEYAAKNKFRYPFKGFITTEDLFDLSLENLDAVYKILNKQVKQVNEESLLDAKTSEDEELDVKIQIVKYVFNLKTEERNARLVAKERKEQKQKILEIMANKQNEALQSKSIDELQKMLDELD